MVEHKRKSAKMSATAAFLNSLCIQSRTALYTLMLQEIQAESKYQIHGDVTRKQLMRTTGGTLGGGLGWCEFARCWVVGLGSGSEHPRWQIRVRTHNGGEPTATSVGGKVRGALHSSEWRVMAGLGGAGGQIKLHCHHVAYLNHPDFLARPIPTNIVEWRR